MIDRELQKTQESKAVFIHPVEEMYSAIAILMLTDTITTTNDTEHSVTAVCSAELHRRCPSRGSDACGLGLKPNKGTKQ